MTGNNPSPTVSAGLVSVALALAPCPASALDQIASTRDFIDSIGMNVHLMYMDGAYRDLDRVVESLKYLGILNLRDSAPRTDTLTRYNQLAAEGFKFDFFVSSDIPDVVALLRKFEIAHPSSVSGIEGPNEVNNFPITFNGIGGTEGAVSFQSALYDAVKADPQLNNVKVYNFTDYPQPAGKADYMNLHPYPKGGAQPFAYIGPDLSKTALPMPGHDRVITEAGYAELQDPKDWKGQADWSPVDEQTQAILTLNLLLDSFALGSKRTYLYQLTDGYRDEWVQDGDKHLGLFDLNFGAKASATAVHNLVSILNGENAEANSAGPITAALTGSQPSTVHTLQLRKDDGSIILAIWREAEIWNQKLRKRIDHPAEALTVSFGSGLHNGAIYDPVQAASPITTFKQSDHVVFALGDRPFLITISP